MSTDIFEAQKKKLHNFKCQIFRNFKCFRKWAIKEHFDHVMLSLLNFQEQQVLLKQLLLSVTCQKKKNLLKKMYLPSHGAQKEVSRRVSEGRPEVSNMAEKFCECEGHSSEAVNETKRPNLTWKECKKAMSAQIPTDKHVLKTCQQFAQEKTNLHKERMSHHWSPILETWLFRLAHPP